MNILKKVLKWIGTTIGSILLLIILCGFAFRLLGPEPHEPMGELVDIGGFKLHINSTGAKSDKPTLVIEGGGGMATEYFHWLSEGLKDSIRVVRYDRAGIGYSEASNTPRDPETIARELHTLLELAGESPPYIMAGHSLGGPYVRVFTELYPDEVVALCLLDTTHPERVKRIKSIPQQSSWKFKSVLWAQRAQSILGDMGILLLYDKIFGPSFSRAMEGLPMEINDRTVDFIIDGKYARALNKEFSNYHNTLQRAGEVIDFQSLPLRVFPASATRIIPEEVYQKYLKRGMDLREIQKLSRKLQEDLLNLSTDSKLIEVNGDHTSIFTKKENAAIICKEVISLLQELKD